MPDREKVIKGLEADIRPISGDSNCGECPYCIENDGWCTTRLMEDALELLKEQEPRLIAEDDFKSADEWGWIPAWCEEKDGSSYWEMITVGALEETKYQYWTARPTDEQRKAVKWNA